MNFKKDVLQFNNFVWIDICHPQKADLDEIAQIYNLDYYQIKDSLEAGHLPKFETCANYNFLILRAFQHGFTDHSSTINQLSNKIAFFYNYHKIITIHRSEFSFIDPLKKNTYHSSFEVLIAIVDAMLFTYVEPVQQLDDKIEDFEKNIFLKDKARLSLKELYYLKAQTRISKKLILLNQSAIMQIPVDNEYHGAIQEIKDRLTGLQLNFDEVLENANNLLSTYLSVNAQKNNDVMKLLTIFSAFFLPLSFIAGIYGMNFHHMPELDYQYGYIACLSFMAIVASLIFAWFKRKRIL